MWLIFCGPVNTVPSYWSGTYRWVPVPQLIRSFLGSWSSSWVQIQEGQTTKTLHRCLNECILEWKPSAGLSDHVWLLHSDSSPAVWKTSVRLPHLLRTVWGTHIHTKYTHTPLWGSINDVSTTFCCFPAYLPFVHSCRMGWAVRPYWLQLHLLRWPLHTHAWSHTRAHIYSHTRSLSHTHTPSLVKSHIRSSCFFSSCLYW